MRRLTPGVPVHGKHGEAGRLFVLDRAFQTKSFCAMGDKGPFAFVKPNFPATAFVGTAKHYLMYRPSYPKELLRDLLVRAGADARGTLLDLATGPGRVALELSPSFREVWAIDLEPEMIEVGRRAAEERGLKNIKWMTGRAEDLEAPACSFDLITIGEAFHRLDQRRVCSRALEWLNPGCLLATLGSYGLLSDAVPWHKAVTGVVRKWTGWVSPIANEPPKPLPGGGPKFSEWALRETGFVDVSSHEFSVPLRWTVEAILGYLYSTSICSEKVLGANRGPFEKDIRAALHGLDPSGLFAEDAQFGFTMGRRKK